MFPAEVRMRIESMAAGRETELCRAAESLSEAYRNRTGTGKRLVTADLSALAYACARMPATFSAAERALSLIPGLAELNLTNLLDCGAGTGAVSFAASPYVQKIICLEREEAMRKVGSGLTEAAGLHASWQAFDLTDPAPLPEASLVCEGYMLGEMAQENRLKAADRLAAAARTLLVLIEPGTPEGFFNLRAVRERLTESGWHTWAPCPGDGTCKMAGDDWCHFAVRVERTRLMKRLKGGEAPYEDEKFCFLAMGREKAETCSARVLRHPQIAPGRIDMKLCTEHGTEVRTVTKKDPLWKRARKAGWGEAL